MIHEAKHQVDPGEYPLLRVVALTALRRWAWAASEQPDALADMLGATDTPARRAALAKIFQNLGRTPPTPE